MRVCITGITGTIGTALTKALINQGNSVVGISRDEFKQHHFIFKNHHSVKLMLGDIRSLDDCMKAVEGAEVVIHAAALKHVDKLERDPEQAIKTNIEGTRNILKAQRLLNSFSVTMLSTDKAVLPVNVYGHTKAIAERLVLEASPCNKVIRYGNVINSRGSVLESFIPSIKKNFEVNITHRAMTRFFITIEKAVEFILANGLHYKKGGLFVPEMKAISIVDLAQIVANAVSYEMGTGEMPVKIKDIGIRPGEKLHECLYRSDEGFGKKSFYSNKAEEFSHDELFDIVLGILKAQK